MGTKLDVAAIRHVWQRRTTIDKQFARNRIFSEVSTQIICVIGPMSEQRLTIIERQIERRAVRRGRQLSLSRTAAEQDERCETIKGRFIGNLAVIDVES